MPLPGLPQVLRDGMSNPFLRSSVEAALTRPTEVEVVEAALTGPHWVSILPIDADLAPFECNLC